MTSSSGASSIGIGSYQLFERIGEGGSAEVFRGRAADGSAVAIKLLKVPVLGEGETPARRFEAEVAALAALDHPGLARLLDHGTDDELGPYLVTPLYPGESLRARLAGIALCPEGAILALTALADATAALHATGLIHRDLKPENILASPEGRLIIVDLGLALAPGRTRFTEEGTVVGSVPYMAPEQLEGRPVDSAADVWALGVMAYEWITGRRPFHRERVSEEAAAALVGSFVPLDAADRRVAGDLATLVGACLSADPRARPTAAELSRRAAALVDWTDTADQARELAAVFADPRAYQERVTPLRLSRQRRLADAAVTRGEPFVALSHIDRGLAYRGDDETLLALATRAESAGATRPAAPAQASAGLADDLEARRRAVPWRWILSTAAVVAASIAVTALVLAPAPPEQAAPAHEPGYDPWLDVKPKSPAQRAKEAADRELVVGVMGGMIDVFDRGLALEERAQGVRLPHDVETLAPRVLSNTAGTPVSVAESHRDEKPFTVAIERDGEDAVALRERGLVRLRGGRIRDAYADLTAALRLAPDDGATLRALAEIYRGAGRDADARRLLDAAVGR